jgi:hypothetical protein
MNLTPICTLAPKYLDLAAFSQSILNNFTQFKINVV